MKYTLNIVKKLTILSLFIACLLSCSEDDNVDATNAAIEIEYLNVSYGDKPLQKYDIYLPENRTNSATKVLILVHGGSWISGDKNDLNPFVAVLKTKFPNYAIVNINYQLAGIGKSPFPMQINDIQEVLEHLKRKSNEYKITSRYGFIGASAGGHLALLYSYAYNNLKEVEMVCSIVGPTNFTDENYISNPNYSNFIKGMQLITNVSFEDNPAYYKNLSPYHIVTSTAPPTLLFYGGKDDLVPSAQGLDLHDKLDELNVINEFTLYENEGHGWQGAALNDTYDKLENFISVYF